MSSRRILMMGLPGAGKGTQAVRLAEELRLPHIATGDMLRQEVAARSELGKAAQEYMDAGEYVPDEVVIGMLLERLSRPDASAGFILDGFPRTLPQVKALHERMGNHALDVVLYLEVPEEEIVRRISGRRSCVEGHVYHVEDDPPRQSGVCDQDGRPLFQRDDDREDVVRNRLRVFREQTEPVVDFYRQRGLLRRVEGLGDRDRVAKRILEAA
ncbi:MAG: adenylate kinase [Actinomycetota bacterium]|nr:adenylate kinase [Actinomycetota bacterium]